MRFPAKVFLLFVSIVPLLIGIVYGCYKCHWSEYWQTINYFVGYQYGFGGRKLVGSTLGLLLPEFVTTNSIRNIVLPSLILLLVVFLWLMINGCSKPSKGQYPFVFLFVVYTISPFSFLNYYRSGLAYGCMETYQLILVLSWLLLYVYKRGSWFYYVWTFVVVTICCLIHHTFVCTIFPLIFGLVVYDVLSEDNHVKVKVVIYIIEFFALASLFLFIWNFSKMTISIDELYEVINARTNQDVLDPIYGKDGIRLLYYMTNAENAENAMTLKIHIRSVIEWIMMLPLLLTLCYPWYVSAKKSTSVSQKLRYYLPCGLVIMMSIPIFIMAYDFSRWWTCLFFCLIALSCVAHLIGDDFFDESLESFNETCAQKWWMPISLIVYLSQLHNANDMFCGLEESSIVVDLFDRFFVS